MVSRHVSRILILCKWAILLALKIDTKLVLIHVKNKSQPFATIQCICVCVCGTVVTIEGEEEGEVFETKKGHTQQICTLNFKERQGTVTVHCRERVERQGTVTVFI